MLLTICHGVFETWNGNVVESLDDDIAYLERHSPMALGRSLRSLNLKNGKEAADDCLKIEQATKEGC